MESLISEFQRITLLNRSIPTTKILMQLELFEKFLILNNYSKQSINSYSSHLFQFLSFLEESDINVISVLEIRKYIESKIGQNKWSTQTQQQSLNAIQLYVNQIIGISINVSMLRPKVILNPPEILSQEELSYLINNITNLKFKLIVMLIYSGGLKLNEVINLKLSDIDFKNNKIKIRHSKLNYRYSLLSQNMMVDLHNYVFKYDIKTWLFEGEGKQDKPCSLRSVQIVFKKLLIKLNISKAVTLQSLRHSFAVHLIEKGVSTTELNALMGHKSMKTTNLYLHLAKKSQTKIISPLDYISLDRFVNTTKSFLVNEI